MSSPTSSKKAKPQPLSRSQVEKVLKLWTQGPLSLQCVWKRWAEQQTLKCRKKVIGGLVLKYMCKQKGWNSPVGSFAGISTCIQSYQVWVLIMTFWLWELGILKIQCFKSLSALDDFFLKTLIPPVLHLLISLQMSPSLSRLLEESCQQTGSIQWIQ